jgi:DNA-binding transcriptional regulator YdaS (Cro superfamily)
MHLHRYLKEERGRAVKVARDIGVHPVLVRQWAAGRPIPVEHIAALEMATGGEISRKRVRPNDWARIWPELAQAA